MNRLWNCRNPDQGPAPRVLCVCSAGLLRSPTTAWVLSQDPWNFNTRACGLEDYALIPMDEVLLTWADLIICMNGMQVKRVEDKITDIVKKGRPICPQVINFNIPDDFAFRDPTLVEIIRGKASTLKVILGEESNQDESDKSQGN